MTQVKLLFFYIHEYKNIIGQCLNVSSEFHFDFSLDDNTEALKLIISKSQRDLPHLFHPDIIDIKGIIGENGSGKTNFLHYLSFKCFEHTVEFGSTLLPAKDILVYIVHDYNGNPRIKVNAGKDWDKKISIENKTDISFNSSEDLQLSTSIYWDDISDFESTSFIFYSNIFDRKQEEENNGLINVSTNYLTVADSERLTNNQYQISSIVAHRLMEAKRQLYFALRFDEGLPIDRPKTLTIETSNFSGNLIRSLLSSSMQTKKTLDEQSVALVTRWLELSGGDKYFNQTDFDNVRIILHKAFLDYTIYHGILDYGSTIDDHFPQYKSYTLDILTKILDVYELGQGIMNFGTIVQYAKNLEENLYKDIQTPERVLRVGIGDSSLSRAFQSYIDFERTLFTHGPTFYLYSKTRFEIEINDNTELIIDSYSRTVFITDYLFFSFPRLSSGQTGLLTLFSRFFSLVDHRNRTSHKIEEHIKNLIILIDEGDLYFHPQWQTKFISLVNKYLPLIFPKLRIQLITTSHSQFIVSDLPLENLLFMKRGESGNCNVVVTTKETFAANIHTLLADTFFIQGAHIGGFAKEMIFKIIDQMDGKSVVDPFTNDQIRAVIEALGEPWVKSRLLEKYQSMMLNK